MVWQARPEGKAKSGVGGASKGLIQDLMRNSPARAILLARYFYDVGNGWARCPLKLPHGEPLGATPPPKQRQTTGIHLRAGHWLGGKDYTHMPTTSYVHSGTLPIC